MNIKKAKEEIRDTIEAYLLKNPRGEYVIPAMRQRPVLLMGPPGIGKTQIMEQIAMECGIGLVAYTITHHTRQSAIGLPFIQERNYGGNVRHVTEYTMSEIVASVYDRMEETGLSEGILFIDEVNCVSETLAPAMLQFLQYKTFGNHRIPDGWIIVSAGNPPEYNKSVREFDMATLDRVKRMDVEPDFQVWKEYAKQADVHPAVISYLTARPRYFYQVETTVGGKQFATPRGWEDLSGFLKVREQLGKTMDRDSVAQYIQHPRISRDFANYLELYHKYQEQYQAAEVLKGHRDPALMEKAARAPFDEKLSIISLLLAELETAFRSWGRKEDQLEIIMDVLKELREQLNSPEGEAGEGPVMLETQIRHLDEIREKKKKSGLLSRERDYMYRDAEEKLNRFLQTVRSEGLRMPSPLFDRIRQLFGYEKDEFEAFSAEVQEKLEYAFDFMEGTFGDSQEMVIFITELNTGPHAVRFLQENECERYYQYNQRLLFEDRAGELKRRLEQLEEL